MANAASTIEIELEIRQAIGRLNNLQKELNQTTQNFNKASDSTRKFEAAIGKAKTAAVAFFSVLTAKKIAEFSDVMTQFENRVKLATNSLNQQIAVQGELIKVAQQTATPLADIGELYSRMRLAAEQLEASQRDLINITKTVGLTLKTQGTSATEAAGALQQLGQAFTSPIVQAEEFNSIQDALPALLVQVTKNLGLQQGQLKKYVNDQKLSNKDLFDAILASQKALEDQANLAANTFESFGTRVNNTVTSSIGALSRFMGATLTKRFKEFKDGILDTFPALDSFATKLGKALTIGPGSLDKFTRLFVLGQQPPEEGGGEANLDEVIKEQTGLITDLEASFKGLSLYATTQIMAISEAFEDPNLTIEEYTKKVEAFVKSYTEFYDKVDSGELPGFPALQFDPETQEQLFLSAEQASKEFELIFKFIAQGFKAFENLNGEAEKYLTYLERITNALSEQLRLLELSEENANRTAGAIVSGVSGAGPNATRASNIAQSKSFEEATAKLILSNEKVGKAIDSSFELLFDVLDPFLDLLGDLISAINRLISALIENATSAVEGILDTVGLGPNGYIFGGGLANDLEAAFSSSRPGGPTNQQKAFAQADSIFASIADAPSTRDQLQPTIDDLSVLIPDLGLTEIINRITQNTEESLASLNAVQEINFKTLAAAPPYLMNQIGKEITKVNEKIKETEEKSKIVIQGLIEAYIQEPLNALDDLTQSAEDQIEAIEFQNLTAEEQIQLRYDEAFALIIQQRNLAILIDDENLRNELMNAVHKATVTQNELLKKQKEELQKLNEERERELNLQRQNNLQNALIQVFNDFERGLSDISEIIDGLNTQINDLLFSDFNLAPASDSLQIATKTYGDLFAAALDPAATEEDVKAFQGFVDTYLRGARDVFKSSTAYRKIFDQVLVDLQQIGLAYGQSAPVNLIENIKDELESLETEFGTSLTTLIQELDRLGTVFANQSYAYSGVISVDLGTIDTTFDSSGFTGAINDLNLTIANTITAFIQTMDTSKTALDTFNQTGTVTPVTPAPVMGTLLEQLAVGGNAKNFSGNIEASEDYASATGNNSIGDIAAALVNAIKSNSELNVTDFVFGISFGYAGTDTNQVAFYPSKDIPQSQYSILSTGIRDKQKYGFGHGGIVDPMDTIPAMLSPGEYILSPETVRRYGVSNLNRLNSTDSAAINLTGDLEVKRLLAELIVAVKENDTEVNVYTDMQGQTKASIEEFRSELRERTRRQGDKFLPARYI